jgi:hypothetical protein
VREAEASPADDIDDDGTAGYGDAIAAANLAPPAVPISIPPSGASLPPVSSRFLPSVSASYAPDGVPVSLVGQQPATLSLQAPTQPGLSLRLVATIAICSVVSFAAGLFFAQLPVDVRVSGVDSPTTEASASPTAAPATAAPAATAAQATATAAPVDQRAAPRASASAVASAAAPAPAATSDRPDPEDDGSRLPESHGYLLVRTQTEDAHVYINGMPLGRAGEKLISRCGVLNVRLGTVPLTRWFGRGRAVPIACQGVTAVTIVPWESAESTRAKPRPGTYVPDDL